MAKEAAVCEPVSGSGRIITVDLETTIADAAGTLRAHTIGCLVVTDAHGMLVGILSERDIVYRLVADCADPSKTCAGDIMTVDVTSCVAGTPLREVEEVMTARNIRHLPIVEDGVPVGMISSREVMASQHAKEQGMRDVTIFALAKLAESRDPETGQHLERVRSYARTLAEDLAGHGKFVRQIDGDFVRLMYLGSPLHDVGKVGIPDHVLLKPGRLDDREFAIMKTHCAKGAATLDSALRRYPEADFLRTARDIAASHHERIDGTGYPGGIGSEEIPLAARIFALADVYDALVSKRVYKDAFAHDVAKSIVLDAQGSQLDPDVVRAFLRCEEAFIAIRDRYNETEAAA